MNDTEVKLNGYGKGMVKSMVRSWEAPQFSARTQVACAGLIKYAKSFEEKTSYTAVLAKLVADTLEEFPKMNASFGETSVMYHKEKNIGIATDTDNGLIVPVIKSAETKTVELINQRLNEIKEKRKLGKFGLDDITDCTFIISNLGMFNVTDFDSIVTYPNTAILSVAKMMDVPAVKDGEIVIEKQMNIGVSVDHRIVDGATAARFLTKLAEKIEAL